MMECFERLKSFLLELFWPRRAVCMGCGSMHGCERDDLCEDCREKMASQWVGLRQPKKNSGMDGCAYAYRYHGPAGGMVRGLKYRGVWVLADEMGRDIARAAQLLRIEDECFAASVPMHPRRMHLRGRNHAEVLARRAAQGLNLEYLDLLERTRNAPQQARLSHEQRMQNLRGGFRVKAEYADLIRDADVLLIDDVYTTGATAACCAEALKKAGAGRVYFAAYCYGERKKHG